MQREDKIKYLKQYRENVTECKTIEGQIKAWEELKNIERIEEGKTQKLKKEIYTKQKELEEKLTKTKNMLDDVIATLDKLDNTEEKLVLINRYILGLSMEDTAKILDTAQGVRIEFLTEQLGI